MLYFLKKENGYIYMSLENVIDFSTIGIEYNTIDFEMIHDEIQRIISGEIFTYNGYTFIAIEQEMNLMTETEEEMLFQDSYEYDYISYTELFPKDIENYEIYRTSSGLYLYK